MVMCKFGGPMFESKVVRKQMNSSFLVFKTVVLRKVLMTLL